MNLSALEASVRHIYDNMVLINERNVRKNKFYPGSVLLFCGKETIEQRNSKAAGWETCCANLEIVDVPFPHATFMSKAAAAAIGCEIIKWLKK